MKKIKITITANWTEEFYKEDGLELKNHILSGEMQRDLIQDGVSDVKATFEIIK